jgi:hypothetical protein
LRDAHQIPNLKPYTLNPKPSTSARRTLIKEDKVDEARKIDPNQYQNIVDVDEIFRKVKPSSHPAPGGVEPRISWFGNRREDWG